MSDERTRPVSNVTSSPFFDLFPRFNYAHMFSSRELPHTETIETAPYSLGLDAIYLFSPCPPILELKGHVIELNKSIFAYQPNSRPSTVLTCFGIAVLVGILCTISAMVRPNMFHETSHQNGKKDYVRGVIGGVISVSSAVGFAVMTFYYYTTAKKLQRQMIDNCETISQTLTSYRVSFVYYPGSVFPLTKSYVRIRIAQEKSETQPTVTITKGVPLYRQSNRLQQITTSPITGAALTPGEGLDSMRLGAEGVYQGTVVSELPI